MPSAIDPGHLQLSVLRQRCAAETDLFFRQQEHDPRFCFELFRRAIVERDEGAWQIIYRQYRPLVIGWVNHHSLTSTLEEEIQFFVNRAFERMWHGLTAAKFSNFPDLKSVLRYFQVCVHAVLVDFARVGERAKLFEDEAGITGPQAEGHQRPLEEGVLNKALAENLWSLLVARCKNDQERRVLSGIFVNGLKPRELYDQYPRLFRSVQEVYRVKENLLARLQRDNDLMQYLENLQP
ncbi:MAG TPA: hypothetical protein VLA49_01365 [Anaerolineales bacterium]|nr:hypothetical protein [Anaerolineales bacterium]